MFHRFFDRSPNRPPFNHSSLPLPTDVGPSNQHGNRDQAVRHNRHPGEGRQQQHRRERSPPRDPRLAHNGNQPNFQAARGQERGPGHQQTQAAGNRPSHQQARGQPLAPPQAAGYQQAPPQAPGYQQASPPTPANQQALSQAAAYQQPPPHATAYQQPPPQAIAYQPAPPQAPVYQPAPPQAPTYLQALRQQAIEQHQLAGQQMAPQLARGEDVDARQHPNGRGAQSPHGQKAQVADHSRQREEQMRREQSRERSTPRDPRAGHSQDARGQEQADPSTHRQQEHERRQHRARSEDEDGRRSRHQENREQQRLVYQPILQEPARVQEQAPPQTPRHHHAPPSVPQHHQAQVLAQPVFEEEEHRQHLARIEDEDGLRRHQGRLVQIKQEPDDELTIIAEFRGDGVEAARMEKQAQIFRKEQYKIREALRREKERMMTEIEEKKCAADIELARMELEEKEREIAHKRAIQAAAEKLHLAEEDKKSAEAELKVQELKRTWLQLNMTKKENDETERNARLMQTGPDATQDLNADGTGPSSSCPAPPRRVGRPRRAARNVATNQPVPTVNRSRTRAQTAKKIKEEAARQKKREEDSLPGDLNQLLRQAPPPPPPGHHSSPKPVPPSLPAPALIPLNRSPTDVLCDPRLQPKEESSQHSGDADQVKKELRRIEQAARHQGQKRSVEGKKAPAIRIKPEPIDDNDEISVMAEVKGQGYEAACKASEDAKLRKRARQIKEGQKKERGDIEKWKQESLTGIAKDRAEAELEMEATEVARIMREAETKKALEELQKEIDKELVNEKMLELKRLKQSNAIRQEEIDRFGANYPANGLYLGSGPITWTPGAQISGSNASHKGYA